MLTLSSPGKAFLVLLIISVSVSEWGLENTALTLFIFIAGLVVYNWWVKGFKV